MFSPDASIHGSVSTQRNPRRRQRTHSDDSVAIRRPAKRPRKPLAQDTFEPLSDEKTNGHTQGSAAINGHAVSGRSTRDASSETTSLAYRVGKKQEREKRGGQGDGGIILVSIASIEELCPCMILLTVVAGIRLRTRTTLLHSFLHCQTICGPTSLVRCESIYS